MRQRVFRDPIVRARWMAARIKHGAYVNGREKPEHYIWREMLRRCKNSHPNYAHVTVCKRWRRFENFLKDMGPRPSPKHSLDRFPNCFGNYKPSNCRWATTSEQMRNKRTTRRWREGKVVDDLKGWATTLGISVPLARFRWRSWGTFQKGRRWCELQNPMKRQTSRNTSMALAHGTSRR